MNKEKKKKKEKESLLPKGVSGKPWGGEKEGAEAGGGALGNMLLMDKDAKLAQYSNVPVQEFEPGVHPETKAFYTVTVYGKRRSGKSVFMKWFLQFYKHLYPWAWCFTLTKMNSWYASFMPKKFILEDFSPEG